MVRFGGSALVWLLVFCVMVPAAYAEEPRFLHEPDVSTESIVFVYGSDLWIVPLEGGRAKRLTSLAGRESHPRVAPDGATVAFSAEPEGQADLYLIGVTGGEPRRLTYHPSRDLVQGWSPDGRRVLFSSDRASDHFRPRLMTIDGSGGHPEAFPMHKAFRGAFSPDGRRLAFTPVRDAFRTWKRYRGGEAAKIWLVDLQDYSHLKIPRDDSNDTAPVWLGDSVYFLSDRSGVMSVLRYDVDTGAVEAVVDNDLTDIDSLAGSHGRLVYSSGGLRLPLRHRGEERPPRQHFRRRRRWRDDPWTEESRRADRRRRPLPGRVAGGLRGARRARGRVAEQRALGEPDPRLGLRRAKPRLVARRQVARLRVGRGRRVRALRQGRHGRGHCDTDRRREAGLLAGAFVVAGRSQARLPRQASSALVGRPRQPRAHAHRVSRPSRRSLRVDPRQSRHRLRRSAPDAVPDLDAPLARVESLATASRTAWATLTSPPSVRGRSSALLPRKHERRPSEDRARPLCHPPPERGDVVGVRGAAPRRRAVTLRADVRFARIYRIRGRPVPHRHRGPRGAHRARGRSPPRATPSCAPRMGCSFCASCRPRAASPASRG